MNFNRVKVFFIVFVFSLLSLGCATPLKQSLEKVNTGMDKSDVLNLTGSPWITRRVKSQDQWIFRFYENDQEYRKQLTFEYGKVINISSAKPYPNPEVKLEDADSIEEFRDAAELKQKSYNSGFKKIDSDSDDD